MYGGTLLACAARGTHISRHKCAFLDHFHGTELSTRFQGNDLSPPPPIFLFRGSSFRKCPVCQGFCPPPPPRIFAFVLSCFLCVLFCQLSCLSAMYRELVARSKALHFLMKFISSICRDPPFSREQ